MKKFVWAALAALSFATWGAASASAEEGFGFQAQICYHRYRVNIPWPDICSFFGCGCGCGATPACGICNPYAFNQCAGMVTGPWYTFWPAPGASYMTSSYTQPNWMYDDNFRVPAPPPYGYGYAPVAAVSPMPTAFQPANYYPSYWYANR